MQKVFIVEDSPLIRERLRDAFSAIPGVCVVGEASSAREAIVAMIEARPDVAIVDLGLQHGSGFDVLAAVQELAPEIAVYILSNFAGEPFRRRAERLGARGFFDKSSQFESVRETLAQRAAAAPAQAAH